MQVWGFNMYWRYIHSFDIALFENAYFWPACKQKSGGGDVMCVVSVFENTNEIQTLQILLMKFQPLVWSKPFHYIYLFVSSQRLICFFDQN